MTRVQWLAGCAIAASAVLLIAGPSPASAVAPRSSLDSVGSATCASDVRQTNLQDLHKVNDVISTLAGFTGVALPEDCGPVQVYATADALPSLEQHALRTASDPSNLRYHPVAHDWNHLMQTHTALMKQGQQLLDSGIDIYQYWPDMTTGYETLQLGHASASDMARVRATVDPEVKIVVMDGPSRAVVATVDRDHDVLPFSAGDWVSSVDSATQGVSGCSTGAEVHSGTAHFAMFAGHCSTSGTGSSTRAANQTLWNNSYSDGNGVLQGTNAPVGIVTAQSWDSGYDIALINVSPAAGGTVNGTGPTIWAGSSTSPSKYQQAGVRRPLVGDYICTDGAYEGQQCNAKVASAPYLACVPLTLDPLVASHQECGELSATSTQIIVGEGDSGGPVWSQVAGTGLSMSGIISAESSPLLACNAYTFRGNVCSKTVLFTDLYTALHTATGTTLNTPGSP